MKILSITLVSAVLFCLFMVVAFRLSRRNPPDKLKALQSLLPADWKLVTWGWWEMGWFAKFEFCGRRFDVGSHRDDIEIVELVGTDRRVVATGKGQKSPGQIYELLAKAA